MIMLPTIIFTIHHQAVATAFFRPPSAAQGRQEGVHSQNNHVVLAAFDLSALGFLLALTLLPLEKWLYWPWLRRVLHNTP